MNAWATGLTIALAVSAPVAADEFSDNGLWIEVKHELLTSKWPHDADGNLIYGKVLLDCAIGKNHFATDCKVKASQPEDATLGRAALELAPLFKTWKTWGSKLSRATLVVDMRYDQPPEPTSRPSYDQMMSVYPLTARTRDAKDVATFRCVVQVTGTPRACSVVSEDRPGLGIGPAGLAVVQTMRFKPAVRRGQSVEAEITLPLVWQFDFHP
jgi:hypothetical protein